MPHSLLDAALCTPWLTLADAGMYLKRGKRFLVREVNAGRLRAARIGGKREILTRREWLDQWVSDQAEPVAVRPQRRHA